MAKQNLFRYWSDNWIIDGDKIWFMAGDADYLFCIDKDTKESVFVSEIPEDNPVGFRGHPRCIKNGEQIFCLPDRGENIWRYDILCSLWEMIPVKNTEGVRLCCRNAWFIKDRLYAVSIGLRKLLELDIRTCKISYYGICADAKQSVSRSVLKDGCIYAVCSNPAAVYKFDCLNKKAEMHLLPEINDQLGTICFDGKNFWMSGGKKRIYIWEEETGKCVVLDGFPDSFGIYNFSGKYEDVLNCEVETAHVPLFIGSASVGRYVWFVPFQTNEILYVDKDDFSINVFHLEHETQTKEDMSTQLLAGKYLLEYVRDDRFIGLYSLKNRWIVEIDSRELQYRVMDYKANELKVLLGMVKNKEKKIVKSEGRGVEYPT